MVGGGRNQKKEFSCVCLHGDRKPQERKENLEIFKRKEVSKEKKCRQLKLSVKLCYIYICFP